MRKFLSILFAVPVGIATYLGIKLALGQNPDDLLDPVLIGIVGLFPLVTCIFALDYETKWGFNPKVTLLVTTLGLPLFMLFIGFFAVIASMFGSAGRTSDFGVLEGVSFLVVMLLVGLTTGLTYVGVSRLYLRITGRTHKVG